MSQINKTRDAGIITYPEMDGKIVELLTFRGDPTSYYAALRIKELEAETGRLREQAQRAEAATREAVAREAVLAQALEATWDARESMSYRDDDVGWVFHLDGHTTDTVREALRDRSTAGTALLERLAELETQVADLRGALQAALLPLERAADALVPEARVAEAAALVEGALVVIREELEE